ncbi:MAG: arsenic efflux protein [Bacilli bacterium]|nr:arsenic efflux protein [Bacilli bacterium]
MTECIIDGVIDTLKLLPYLLITFIIIEYIEHKLSKKNQKVLVENEKYGPILGGILGAIPQCGFSSMAANLFSGRVITMGTLIAVFLSTSDEMLPIMISEHADILLLLKIIGFKIIVGIIIGFIIDIFYRKKHNKDNIDISHICEHDHCDCKHNGIIKSSIKHTIKIGLFILIVNLLLNIIIFKVGEDNLSNLLLHKNIFTYFIASIIGLIPNCASSVLITELYLSKLITIGTLLSGLLTGSGLGILLLFKTNNKLKENLTIVSIIYFVGVIIGMLVDLFI